MASKSGGGAGKKKEKEKKEREKVSQMCGSIGHRPLRGPCPKAFDCAQKMVVAKTRLLERRVKSLLRV